MTDYKVRLVIKQEGIDLINKELERTNDEALKNLIKKADINKTFRNLVYLGWNELDSERYLFLQHRLFDVGCNDISYRITGIGEELTDVQEESYTSPKDVKVDIPYPSVIRTFDENDIEKQMTGYIKYLEEKQNENSKEMDYE
jgi:hypothetical protein